MHILLFGGSFNPPHLGHLIVLEQAFELIPDIDELWLLPTFNHQFGKASIDPAHRLHMCKLLIDEFTTTNHQTAQPPNRLKLCPLEIDYRTSGSTYATLQLLKSETDYLRKTMFPDSLSPSLPDALTFTFLMGSDQLPTFTKWQNWNKLLDEMHFFVYPRAVPASGGAASTLYPHMTLLESPTQVITNISSTIVRDHLHQGKSIGRLVPPAIADYLSTHHLYE